MLIGSLVKATVELQGFRVMNVAGNADGLVATLGPDRRYAPRCSRYRTATPVESDTSGTCRYGESRWCYDTRCGG